MITRLRYTNVWDKHPIDLCVEKRTSGFDLERQECLVI